MATSACHAEVRLAVYRSWGGWPVKRPPFGGYQVPEHAGRVRIVSPRFIRHAHAAGLDVQVWTVDARPDMERLLGWGVDALISNRPDLAVTVRDQGCASCRIETRTVRAAQVGLDAPAYDGVPCVRQPRV